MGIGSRPRRPGPAASRSVADLSTAAHEHGRHPGHDDDFEFEFEFTPLLPHPRRDRGRGATEHPSRTAGHAHGSGAKATPASQRAPAPASASARRRRRPVRWHELAFGPARVPAAMDTGEIRRRLQARQRDDEAAEAWAPWRLIRSLSCRGVEAAAASASAPVRLA